MSKQFYFKQFCLAEICSLNAKTVPSQPMQFSSIWPIDRTLSGATTPGQSGPGSNGKEGVLCIPQSSSIIGASPSHCLVSYSEHSLEGVLSLCRDTVGVFYNTPQKILGSWWLLYSNLILFKESLLILILSASKILRSGVCVCVCYMKMFADFVCIWESKFSIFGG